MNVLFLCLRMVFEDNVRNRKRTTGYSYMVRDIAENIAKKDISVDVLAISDEKNIKNYTGVRVIPRRWVDLFAHMQPYYIFKALKIIKLYKPPVKMAFRVLYYYLCGGYVEKCIKKGNYDLIHIHGLGYGGLAHVECCERLKKKYILTLHSLCSFEERMIVQDGMKQLERDFLKYANAKQIPIITVSTGIMAKIKKYTKYDETKTHFHIVLNGTEVELNNLTTINIRALYCIEEGRKIVLCVGNICHRKNQIQIVRAVKLIPEKVRKNICIMFLGENISDINLDVEISRLGLKDYFRICGNIAKNAIGNYYSQADYTIMASINEAFGLSIIEGFSYGLPNLSFADMDAVQDLYDIKAMIAIKNRTDKALAEGICQLLKKRWDRDYIKHHAKKYSLERMAANYFSLYSNYSQKYVQEKDGHG